MVSRIKRLALSLGVILSLGGAFVPLGCGSSGAAWTPVDLPMHGDRGPELPPGVVEQLTSCVNHAPVPSTSAEGDPPTYVIRFNAYVEEGGSVSSVEIDGSMLGGGSMEACMRAALEGARLPVPLRVSSASSVPASSRGLVAQVLVPPVPPPVLLHPVVLVGAAIIVLVAVTVYIVTRDPTNEEREKERCKEVKEKCIQYCVKWGLPAPGGGRFRHCMRECMEQEGCSY